ncbi:MAG: Spy/CpxP family protein refolding chaperone [Acidobacteriota bacterium]
MFKGLAVVLGVAVVAALAAPAEAQGYRWWQSDRFKTELSLTADQVTGLEDVFQGLLPRLTSGKDEVDRLEKQLSDLIREGTASEPEFLKLVDQVEGARAELGKARTLMMYRMYRILTAEQRVKLRALHEQDRKQNRRR